ncbi:protein-L-isoaspartate(D-aspartate) O-methyltransferase [bacterium]|nr:protein-L-isoaspartate(D-aspartate) O-methyltransferase [bacterium]
MRTLILCALAPFVLTATGAEIEKGGWEAMRQSMVEKQIQARGIEDEQVLAAMRAVPRHLFVDPDFEDEAYRDGPLPIGEDQTISQPYIVALMTELAELEPGEKVLEIGTGSGYQAAVLAELGAEVWSVEIIPELGQLARANLKAAGYDGLNLRVADGYLGWPEAAPFDAVILTAAPRKIPQPLKDQLAEGGVLVAPVGGWSQELVTLRKVDGELLRRSVIPVRFVPMTGKALNDR